MQPLTKKQLELLEDYQRSGLKRLDYCKEYKIVPHILDYVVNKQRKLKQLNSVIKDVNLVRVDSIKGRTSSIKVVINESTIIIDSDFDESLLLKLIQVLRT